MEDITLRLGDYAESFLAKCPSDPLAPSYHNARKLKAAQCLVGSREAEAAFHLSEATAACLRTMAVYRHEQIALKTGDKMLKITNYLKPIENIMNTKTFEGSEDEELYPFLREGIKELEGALKDNEMPQEVPPLHRRYLRFTDENNVENFLQILSELPKEWTVVQLTTAYSPSESTKPLHKYRAEIDSVYVSLLRNAYCDAAGCGPLTFRLPANVTKEGERPLFEELYSLLDANLETIENATRTYTQRTIHQYWERRQETDLRMMGVIRTMDREWLRAWRCLLTGELQDPALVGSVRALVDRTCADWGFIRFTEVQKVLLCNLLESSHQASSDELRAALQRVLTRFPAEHSTTDVDTDPPLIGCQNCCKESELHSSDPQKSSKDSRLRCSDRQKSSKGAGSNSRGRQNSLQLNSGDRQKCGKVSELNSRDRQKCSKNSKLHRSDCPEHGKESELQLSDRQKCSKDSELHHSDCKKSNKKCCEKFYILGERCLKCSAKMFEAMHHFTLVDGIKAFMEAAKEIRNNMEFENLKTAKRHPVILIVDEMLDMFPWESLPVLQGHPVSRIESLHLLYTLYRTHEGSIVDGHFLLKRNPVLGTYVINPGNNLDRMEKRMSSFMSYWCPEWSGELSRPPEPDTFVEYLRTSDLFLYCGHGDGCQYACGGGDGAGVESAASGGCAAAAVLSGCGSARLQRAGGRAPPAGSHYHYHIAGSPMVVGMLWEVTDMEVDKVVTTMLALAVPSAAPVPWDAVGKAQWSQGTLDVNVEKKGKFGTEPDLLRAVARARRATTFLMISSSVVARGLPIRLHPGDTAT